MTMVEEVAAALEAEFSWLRRPSTVATGGTANLFLSDLPDAPDAAVALYQYPGSPPERALGMATLWEKPRLQVLVRDPSANQANTRSYEIMTYLNSLVGVHLSGVHYLQIYSVSSPGELGPDANNRQRWTTNFEVWKEMSP